MSHYEWLALVMFFGFFVIIMSGYPVGYSFAATAILFGAIGYFTGSFNLNLVKMMPSRWFGTMSDFTLLAIRSSSSWERCSRRSGWPSGCWKPSAR